MIRNPVRDVFTLFSDIVLTTVVLVGAGMGSVFALRGILLGYGGMLTAFGWR